MSGDWLSYEVIGASDTINDFYGTFPPGTYYGNWSVEAGDVIDFNITSIQDPSINGTLFFGNENDNITFYDVRNIDTAFGIGLGIYPWNGGFLAESSDWDAIITSVQGTNTTVTHIDYHEHILKGMEVTYSIIKFNTTDYYGQFSNFIYHKESGILLEAYTSFGLYELEISLTATNLSLETNISTETTDLYVILPFIFFVPIFSLVKRRKA